MGEIIGFSLSGALVSSTIKIGGMQCCTRVTELTHHIAIADCCCLCGCRRGLWKLAICVLFVWFGEYALGC